MTELEAIAEMRTAFGAYVSKVGELIAHLYDPDADVSDEIMEIVAEVKASTDTLDAVLNPKPAETPEEAPELPLE